VGKYRCLETFDDWAVCAFERTGSDQTAKIRSYEEGRRDAATM
jgi:hypothetical protein